MAGRWRFSLGPRVQPNFLIFESQVVIRRSNVDASGPDWFAVNRVSGRQVTGPAQDVGKYAVSLRRDVQNYKQ
jgi:hypothetical protein